MSQTVTYVSHMPTVQTKLLFCHVYSNYTWYHCKPITSISSNSCFKKTSFVTWRSFRNMRSPHMLDFISVSENFFKYVRSCGVSKKRMRSDHSAVRIDFMNRSIKYKTTFIKKR